MDYELWNLIIISMIALTHCLLINTYRVLIGTKHTYLDEQLFTVNINQYDQLIDGWKVGHFVNYFCIGLLAPKYWYLGILVGILMELLEMFCGKYLVTVRHNLVGDTIINTFGIICGLAACKITGFKLDIIKTLRNIKL